MLYVTDKHCNVTSFVPILRASSSQNVWSRVRGVGRGRGGAKQPQRQGSKAARTRETRPKRDAAGDKGREGSGEEKGRLETAGCGSEAAGAQASHRYASLSVEVSALWASFFCANDFWERDGKDSSRHRTFDFDYTEV